MVIALDHPESNSPVARCDASLRSSFSDESFPNCNNERVADLMNDADVAKIKQFHSSCSERVLLVWTGSIFNIGKKGISSNGSNLLTHYHTGRPCILVAIRTCTSATHCFKGSSLAWYHSYGMSSS